jgi:hypothetical protein
MIVNKKFILALLMIFLELNLKFIHGTKKNLKNINKKNTRGLKNKSQYYPVMLPIIKEDLSKNKNESDENKKDIAEIDIKAQALFEIDEKVIDRGADFLFAIKEDNEIFNKNEDIYAEKINIGNLSILYTHDKKENKKNEVFLLQKFIENYAADILVLFVIRCFLAKNNVNVFVKNKTRMTQAEIKFKRKHFKSPGYQNIQLLEDNLGLYKKILLMLILNILDENSKRVKTSLLDKFIEVLYPKNLFYNNDILKKSFISKLKKIESINKHFNIEDYEAILYFLAYNIKEQPEEFFKFILDKDFLKFVLFNAALKEHDENKRKVDIVDENEVKKEKRLQEEFKINQFSGIMKYYVSILENLFKQ